MPGWLAHMSERRACGCCSTRLCHWHGAGQFLWLAGVDDVWERRADLPRTLADVPAGAPAVLLAHEPDYADDVADLKGAAQVLLQLSGHSHGGQVCIPGLGAPILPYLAEKYPAGAYRVGDMWLYTNRGVGTIQHASAAELPARGYIADLAGCWMNQGQPAKSARKG